MPRILIVDDDRNIVELIRFNLFKERWQVSLAYDGKTAIDLAVRDKPDVIVLDVMLPGADGLEVCRKLRSNKETESIAVIMLSAKTEELDKILGLEIGADDYMTKPFSPRELIARIKVHLRKKNSAIDTAEAAVREINAGNIKMDLEKFEVTVDGFKTNLTLKEFELLRLLMMNSGKVLTREHLLNKIWNYEFRHEDTRTVDVHIRLLRKKIEVDPANPKFIETVRGIGYKFRDKK